MTSSVEQFLKSEQARADIGWLIADLPTARPPASGVCLTSRIATGERRWKMLGDATLSVATLGAWTVVELATRREPSVLVCAYYRPVGERFQVTDLGDGIRTLRLRLGSLIHPNHVLFPADCPPAWQLEMDGAAICAREVHDDCDGPRRTVCAADLVDAICRTMLASHFAAGSGDGESGHATAAENASPSASKSPLDLCAEFDAVDHAELDRRLTVGEALDAACEEALGKRLELALQFEAVLGPVHDEFYERYEELARVNPACSDPAQTVWCQLVYELTLTMNDLTTELSRQIPARRRSAYLETRPYLLAEMRKAYEKLGALLGTAAP